MCLNCTNSYDKVNVWNLYDTDSFKIGLYTVDDDNMVVKQNDSNIGWF